MQVEEAVSITVGLGSWADQEYVGILYPKGVAAAKRLSAYAHVFKRVEVNSSYYATPRQKVVEGWAKQTPDDFTFDIKLHRAFSQSPEKTTREGKLVGYLLDGVQPLIRVGKLGGFLLVAAPSFTSERHRLEELDPLVEALKPHRLAVELRDREWVTGRNRDRTLDYFRERAMVWVCVDMPRLAGSDLMPVLDAVTNPKLAYVRLHGRNQGWLEAKSAADRHAYEYPPREVRELAARVQRLSEDAEQVHVVANNHALDCAPKLALALQKIFGEVARP